MAMRCFRSKHKAKLEAGSDTQIHMRKGKLAFYWYVKSQLMASDDVWIKKGYVTAAGMHISQSYIKCLLSYSSHPRTITTATGLCTRTIPSIVVLP